MSERLLAVPLVLLAGLAVTSAWGQARVNCGPRAAVLAHLADKYGEGRQAMGLSRGMVMEVFGNRDSGSWTITLTSVEGVTCLIASGDGFEAHGDVARRGVPG